MTLSVAWFGPLLARLAVVGTFDNCTMAAGLPFGAQCQPCSHLLGHAIGVTLKKQVFVIYVCDAP